MTEDAKLAETKAGLKNSLREAIEDWSNEQLQGRGWEVLDTYVPDNFADLMAEAAWSVLWAFASLSQHLRQDGHDV